VLGRRARLLVIVPTLTAGGAERVVLTLLQQMDRRRFELALAIVDMRGSVLLADVPHDVEQLDLKCVRVRHALPRIIAMIWRRRPDVVLSTLGHLNLALAMVRPLLPRHVRYVARETSIVSEVNKDYACPACWEHAYRWFYSRFDAVVCQSRVMASDLAENFGVDRSRLTIINNPVDVDRVRRLATEAIDHAGLTGSGEDAHSVLLVAAGRLSHEKGFDLLIDAIGQCRDLPLRLLILGDGPRRLELEQLAIRLDLNDRVRFTGYQPNPFVFFRRADAFVLSSRYEGFPNVVLEALACGTPVIATAARGGLDEMLDGVAGCVQAKDVSATGLAGAIRSWFAGPRQRVDPSCMDRFRAARICADYESVLLPGGGAHGGAD
jgi:glycosyltransferase involved in cell wall biosynthesis